jgi:hypothetical protein
LVVSTHPKTHETKQKLTLDIFGSSKYILKIYQMNNTIVGSF